jgi:hypothetical protein
LQSREQVESVQVRVESKAKHFVRAMKTSRKMLLFSCAAFAVGLVGGYMGAIQIKDRNDVELLRGLMLSGAALKVTECTMVLKSLREDNHDAATDHLESLLDFALIHIAQEYSTERDYFDTTAKALALARDYRAAHPHNNCLESVARKVDAALAKETAVQPSE